MKSIPLRIKFMFFSLAVLAGVMLLAWKGTHATNDVINMAKLRDMVTLTKLQMRVDMMHDAINANIIHSLSAKHSELADIDKEMKENIATAQTALASLNELDIPEEFRADFATLQTNFIEYFIDANKTLEALSADNNAGQSVYKNNFSPTFQKLADLQEKLEDQVNSYSETKAQEGVASAQHEKTLLFYCTVLSIALSIALPLYSYFSMFRPQRKLLAIADCLSSKDISACAAIPYSTRGDEIGALAKTLLTLRQNLAARAELANKFEKNVKHVVDIVASSATEMESTAKLMVHSASQSQDKLAELSMAINGTVSNIQETSAAVEQIYASINEINKQVAQASKVNDNAVVEANQVNTLAETLSAAAAQVNTINSMITAIAGKINLLSLNATIESARAGEAGKGFAVVASEVKTLANQTASSAREITDHIKSIQQSSCDTLSGVKGINMVIAEISHISATIAAAIEEQGTGTRDIAKNMKEAAETAEDVSASAAFASNLAKTTGESAEQILSAAAELSQQAETLRSEVGSFLGNIRGEA